MAAKVDSSGILNCMVLQPCNDYGTYSGSQPESLEEVWKGPTSEMIDITNGVRVFGVSFRSGVEAPALSNSDTWVRSYARPILPSGWFWMLDTVSIENINPAGDHSLLRLRMLAKDSSMYPASGAGAGGQRDYRQTFWTIEWASRQASALLYLSGKAGSCPWVKHVDESKSGEGQTLSVDDMAPIAKLAADAMRQYSASSLDLKPYQFAYYGEVYTLPQEITNGNINPREVVDKYLAGIGPLLHYPIVKRTTTARFKRQQWDANPPKWGSAAGVEDTIAQNLDRIVDLPWSELPFNFDNSSQWKWIKVADNFQTTTVDTTTLQYTRTEVWWGDLSWDEDFYGNNRWEIG